MVRGEGGYITMERNIGGILAGMCGIAIWPSYPIKIGPNPLKPMPAIFFVTYCCIYEEEDNCYQWGSCPSQSATCCKDDRTCWPYDYPIFNGDVSICRKDERQSDLKSLDLRSLVISNHLGSHIRGVYDAQGDSNGKHQSFWRRYFRNFSQCHGIVRVIGGPMRWRTHLKQAGYNLFPNGSCARSVKFVILNSNPDCKFGFEKICFIKT
ncbi:Oryzain alpha chain [Nymphaea thermarum]|nr:Oryzain alpha chain [Nymphaea thermarum]